MQQLISFTSSKLLLNW